MSTLRSVVRDVVGELDADGGGFRTREAADLLVHRVVLDGVLDENGKLTNPAHQLMRLGATKAITEFQPERTVIKRVAESVGQSDFGEYAVGFDHWIQQFTALDETADAIRKKPIRLTLPEVKQVIELCERKSREAGEKARKLRRILRDHPEWEENPTMVLADVLGVKETA